MCLFNSLSSKQMTVIEEQFAISHDAAKIETAIRDVYNDQLKVQAETFSEIKAYIRSQMNESKELQLKKIINLTQYQSAINS